MKSFALALLASLLASTAFAVPVNSTGTVSYTLPTLGCKLGQPVCDVPLTGANALTAIEVYVSTSPIADDFAGPPTLTVGATASSTPVTVAANDGDTVYIRLKARNADGLSPFTNAVTRLVHLPVTPLPPSNVTFTLVIQ